ncbi:hypothetical protein K435DRAFT_796478 [Dendrothele bispora CBS 962.96]|uniref:Uncharacterized protein n=1 Tax=Dendrothele bispora (strain CBS 962.96) TaxID=1314807 RepID=A0A4S8M604_DENBC|nr:hypothetical protein K435DRAFT_796478 [Dendrothele bispora CBS 962.96]
MPNFKFFPAFVHFTTTAFSHLAFAGVDLLRLLTIYNKVQEGLKDKDVAVTVLLETRKSRKISYYHPHHFAKNERMQVTSTLFQLLCIIELFDRCSMAGPLDFTLEINPDKSHRSERREEHGSKSAEEASSINERRKGTDNNIRSNTTATES